jgi:hypothetical protein
MSTPTLASDVVLCSDGAISCLDAASLALLWRCECGEPKRSPLIHIIASVEAQRAIALYDDGLLVLFSWTDEQMTVLDKATVCGRTWVHPAIAAGRLVCRDGRMLYCYALPGAQ